MDFVVGFMLESLTDRVLLVRKNRPTWQRGLLNGAGGKIERISRRGRRGRWETPIEAMVREWREEIGHDHTDWRLIASLSDEREAASFGGRAPVVHFFATMVRWLPKDSGANDVGEAIETVPLIDVPRRRDVLKNLKWLIPRAFEDPDGPVITSIA